MGIAMIGSVSQYTRTMKMTMDWKQKKEEQARQRKIANDRARTEASIEAAEQRIGEIEILFQDSEVATNSVKLQELQQEYDSLQKERDALYEKWIAYAE